MAKKQRQAEQRERAPIPRLQQRYHQEIMPRLAEKIGRTNRLSLPRVEKIVVSMQVHPRRGHDDLVGEEERLYGLLGDQRDADVREDGVQGLVGPASE